MKRFIVSIIPPLLLRLAKWIVAQFITPEWEYIPDGWSAAEIDPKIKGWAHQSILDAYIASWPQFINRLEGTQPFGLAPEQIAQENSIVFHNVIMSFAYALNLAVAQENQLSMLDWGGSIGHYYAISRQIRPDINIEYHCKDFPMFTEYGKTLFPDQFFHADDEWQNYKYDLIVASSSLQYSEDWRAVLHDLAQVTRGYIFITRTPVIHHKPSYVFVQRPYAYHYNTEYLAWCLNRDEVVGQAAMNNMRLVREFLIETPPIINNAPEQCEYRGFLFRRE